MDKPHTPPSRWERHKERTHRRLLAEAERLFRSKGFDAVTVEEIALAADVAKGTFFNYFESKENLLGELLYSRMQALLASPPAPQAHADERIRQLLQTFWDELMPYRHLARRMFAYVLSHPKSDCFAADQLLPAHTLAGLIREGQAQGVFRPDIDAELAGAFLITCFFRLCVMHMRATEDDADAACSLDLINQGLDLLYRGMLDSRD